MERTVRCTPQMISGSNNGNMALSLVAPLNFYYASLGPSGPTRLCFLSASANHPMDALCWPWNILLPWLSTHLDIQCRTTTYRSQRPRSWQSVLPILFTKTPTRILIGGHLRFYETQTKTRPPSHSSCRLVKHRTNKRPT